MAKTKKLKHWNDKERKYVLPKRTRFNMELLPILQNLVSIGLTESDIGAIAGYQGKNADDWLNELKRNYPDVKEACKIGKQIADSFLVAQMFRNAIGYEYEEVEEDFEVKDGELVKTGEKRKVKHHTGNPQLAMFMATNRMPDQFKNRIETTRKGFLLNTNVEISGDQIERLAGKLLEESRKVKAIESTVIEADHKIIDVETEND